MKLPKGWVFIARAVKHGTGIEVEEKELITCCDCKHGDDMEDGYVWCNVHNYYLSYDYYCADGEKG